MSSNSKKHENSEKFKKEFKLVKSKWYGWSKEMTKKTYKRWLIMIHKEDGLEDYENCKDPPGFTTFLISYGNIKIKVVLAYPGDQPVGLAFINNDKSNTPIFNTGYDTCIMENDKHIKDGRRVMKHVKKFEKFMCDVLNETCS